MLPENAPEAWRDRERLWNDVEAFEVRKDAQLVREVEFALPRELSQAQGAARERDHCRNVQGRRGSLLRHMVGSVPRCSHVQRLAAARTMGDDERRVHAMELHDALAVSCRADGHH
ncbi:hypothetical protein A4R29_04205 [Mesorhizobium ciceri biovar biserrulae]|nr:hypothetical protein A4R29_04205 [Mesorhizobium ciceri biovar biserrulae]